MNRQLENARNLAIPPAPQYEIFEYRVEQWPSGHLFVHRRWWLAGADKGIGYVQGTIVGPRGGFKTVYSRLDT